MADGRGEEVDWTTGEITIIFLSLSPSCSTTIDYVTVTCSKSLRPQQEQQQEMLELVKKKNTTDQWIIIGGVMETFVLISSSSPAPASWPAQSEEEDNGKITD